MKTYNKIYSGAVAKWLAVFCLTGVMVPVALAQFESGAELTPQNSVESIGYQNYSNMSEMLTLVCDDAMDVFQGFYGPTTVEVTPFSVISDYKVHKMTMLGITLADQMTSMINSEPAADYRVEKKFPQKMEGVIEEMDGYLRVHISGRNVVGERRGYVANVEMSEPIYRFLHSYVESY